MKKAKPVLILLLKLLVSGGLLVYFFTRIHIERFLHTFASANFSYIGVAAVVYLLSQIASVMRWTILLRPLGFKTPLKSLVNYYLIGMFFNLFTPGTVGGDVSRIYYLARDGESPSDKKWGATTMHATVSVFMDRAVGMVVLVWLGALGLFFSPQYEIPTAIRSLTYALAVGFLIAGALIPALRRMLPEDGYTIIVKLRVALRSYRARWRVIPAAIVLSFFVHIIQAWIHWLLGQALHMEIPFSYCIIIYPLVGTFSSLPISLGGIGLREGGYLFFLQIIGFNSEKGIAFGVLLFLVVIFDSLLGGIVFLFQKGPKPTSVAAKLEAT
jgi:uncharacterized membrane protein YbhN (UPF0104 family)